MNELNIVDLSEEEWESLYYPTYYNPFDCERDCLLRENLTNALTRLKDKESFVLKHRYGFIDYPRSLSQLGSILGLTKEAVRCIEAKSLRKLRHPDIINKLY